MKYQIEILNDTYDLKDYTFSLADKIEELKNKKFSSLKEKCKAYYDFIGDTLGKEPLDSVVGEFSTADPNDIEVLFNEILNIYNEPVEDLKRKEIERRLKSVDGVLNMVNGLKGINKLR